MRDSTLAICPPKPCHLSLSHGAPPPEIDAELAEVERPARARHASWCFGRVKHSYCAPPQDPLPSGQGSSER